MLEEFYKQQGIHFPSPKDKNYKNFNVNKHGITVDKEFLDILKGKEYLTSTHIKFFTNLFQHYFDPQKEILLLDTYFFSDFMPNTTHQIQLIQNSQYDYENDPELAEALRQSQQAEKQNQLQEEIERKVIAQSILDQKHESSNQQDLQSVQELSNTTTQTHPNITYAQNLEVNQIEQQPAIENNQQAEPIQQSPVPVSVVAQEEKIVEEKINNSINDEATNSKQRDAVDEAKQQVCESGQISDSLVINIEQTPSQESCSNSEQSQIKIPPNSHQEQNQQEVTQQQEQIQILFQNQQYVQDNYYPECDDHGIVFEGCQIIEQAYVHDYSAIADRQVFFKKTYNCQSENPLTEKKFTYFPINIQNDHWICVIIFNEIGKFQYLDSLNTLSEEIVDGIRKLLSYKSPQRQWEMIAESPRQHNGYDCGVFCIMAYYQLVRSQIKQSIKNNDYNASKIQVFRKKLMTLAVVACQTEHLTSEIVDLILKQ